MKPTAHIFRPKPSPGDSGVILICGKNWKEIVEQIERALSPEEFNVLLEQKFQEFINLHGKRTSSNKVRFKHFPQSGMSGGVISLNWWKETGLPLLKSRYEAGTKE